MSTLQQSLDAITALQNRRTELVDPEAAIQAATMTLLAQIVATLSTLQSPNPVAVPTADDVRAMVAEAVSEAVSAAFGKLESAASTAAEAQPAVAQNTGSGASPVDPQAGAATGSAALTPAAGGTAPQAQA